MSSSSYPSFSDVHLPSSKGPTSTCQNSSYPSRSSKNVIFFFIKTSLNALAGGSRMEEGILDKWKRT